MPRYRKLYVKTLESFDLADMPDDFTRLLWVLLPLKLCREGRGVDRPQWIRASYFPLRDDVTLQQIQGAMDWFEGRGMLVRYELHDRPYFYIPTFHDYQGTTTKEIESQYPPPPDRCKTHSGVSQESVQSDSRVTPDLLRSESGVTPESVKSESVTDSDSDSTTDSDSEPLLKGNGAGEVVVPPSEVECSIHHVKMPQRSNDKGKMWWSHKIDDVWCQGQDDQWKPPEDSKQRYAGTMPLMAQAMAQRMAEKEASDVDG